MPDILKRIFKPLTSLRLTIVCLSLAMVLVFAGTIAQKDLDAYYAQKKYFNTCWVWWTTGIYPAWMISTKTTWLLSWIPAGKQLPVFPGGYTLGAVFLVNLIAAHTMRFKMSWKKSGIILAHLGLILLLVGGLFTALWSKDTRMVIPAGGDTNYAESFKDTELAIIDKSNPDHDLVVAIPQSYLAKQNEIQSSQLPFSVKPLQYLGNARMAMRAPGSPAQLADKGMGQRMDAVEVPVTTRPEDENYPAMFVQLNTAAGPLGTWLLWAAPFGNELPPQSVTVDGKTYELQLRLKRYYKPYQIHLIKLTNEVYPGTSIPRNFASRIKLNDPSTQENREVMIYMNNPLRYHGETFYQFQTLDSDKYTVFEVVKNPSWWLPYLSCLLVGMGLVIQFGMHLIGFLKRRSA